MNQLWRNQLLASSIESSNSKYLPYKKVFFSVVYHPKNDSLKSSILEYQKLLRFSDRFFTFSSKEIFKQVEELTVFSEWLNWYKDLYYF